MSQQNQIQEMVENVKNGILSKFPLLGATMSALKFEPTTDMPTAATDGDKVMFNPEFIQKLPYNQKIFVFAHEVMHVAFDHLTRSKDKDGYCWNLATDSVINQMLKNANLPMPEGVVDVAGANGKSAEEMYELFDQKRQQSKQQKKSQNQSGQNGSQSQSEQNNSQKGQPEQNGQKNQNNQQNSPQNQEDISFDDIQKQYDEKSIAKQHQKWNEAIKRAEQNKNNQTEQKQKNIEKNFEQKNNERKKELAERIRQKIDNEKQNQQNMNGISGDSFSKYGNVGNAKEVVSWKKILKKELEKEEDRWTYRRANQENDFQARIGSVEIEDMAETEVMLDVSGSISDEFLKGFLRQLKPLLKHSKIKVGFFAEKATQNFQQIKSIKDIDEIEKTLNK